MSILTTVPRCRTDPAAGLPVALRLPLEEYLVAMAARGQAPLTVELKRVHLARFLRWAWDDGRITAIDQITAALLERFRQAVFHTRKRDGWPLALSTQHPAPAPRPLADFLPLAHEIPILGHRPGIGIRVTPGSCAFAGSRADATPSGTIA